MASLAFVKALSLGLAFQPLGLALRDCDAGSFLQTGKAVPWLEPAAQPIKLFLNANLHVLGDVYLGQLKGCSVACEITQEHLEDADVVVWNARWMSPHPGPPPLSSKPSHQQWVFNFDCEGGVKYGRLVHKETVDALAQGIDWTFTYKSSSDFFKPCYMSMGEGAELVEQAELSKDWARNKTQLLLWFVSNCGSKRKATFEALSEKLPADRVKVYGACGERHPCGQSIFRAKDCIQRHLRHRRRVFVCELLRFRSSGELVLQRFHVGMTINHPTEPSGARQTGCLPDDTLVYNFAYATYHRT